jgi:hypothetical protein
MKCKICNEEIEENDFKIYLHFAQNHKKELMETAKNIKEGVKEQKKLNQKVNKDVHGNDNISNIKGGESKR